VLIKAVNKYVDEIDNWFPKELKDICTGGSIDPY
jgi:hypothetical protein